MTSNRWFRVLAIAAPLLITAAVTPSFVAAGAPAPPDASAEASGPAPSSDAAQEDQLAEGELLYRQGCASCHGTDGRGVKGPEGATRGPTLENAGEASAYYYLSTGRMPLARGDQQPERTTPAYSDDEIDALVSYVATLGDGPDLPELDLDQADLAQGGLIYRGNCQACHSSSGSGGALSYGRAAPGLADSETQEIGAAVRVGPGQMPVFGPGVVNEEELDSLVAYVEYLQNPEDPGGLPIGRTGPIPEGFIAWLIGMGSLLLLVAWIGTRSPLPRRTDR